MEENHIGKNIKQKLSERKITVAEFARLIHTSRTNAYYIFSQQSINYDRLKLISKVLNHDFCADTQNISADKKLLVLIEVQENQLENVKKNFNVKLVMSEI